MEEQDENEIGAYMAEIICSNCKKTREFSVPLGEKVDDYLWNEICAFCGCNVIERRRFQK
jgi:hypothetical protein